MRVRAYLVNSNSVRLARFGGNWYNGPNAGFSNVNANNAPSNGNANYGGDLYPLSRTIQPNKTGCIKYILSA